MSLIDIRNTYDVHASEMEYNSLISAIPREWKHKVENCLPENLTSKKVHFQEFINSITSSKVYWNNVNTITEMPTCIPKWIEEFTFLTDRDFKDFFSLPSMVTNDVKLQCFQYKILQRLAPCNYMLHKWKIESSNKCNLCPEIDTIEHYFYLCTKSRIFWEKIESYFASTTNVHIPVRFSNVIFSIPYTKSQDNTMYQLNFIILQGKWFIYKCKREQRDVNDIAFINYFKKALQTGLECSRVGGYYIEYNKIWHPFL